MRRCRKRSEVPFSEETKRVLQYAAQEADRLLHNHIGTEHLLLGLFREEHGMAASILNELGSSSRGGSRSDREMRQHRIGSASRFPSGCRCRLVTRASCAFHQAGVRLTRGRSW